MSACVATLSYKTGHCGNEQNSEINLFKSKKERKLNCPLSVSYIKYLQFQCSIFSCQIISGPVFVSHPPKQINTILLCSAWLLELHSPSDRRPELCLLVCLLEYWMHVVLSTSQQYVTSMLDSLLRIILQWNILSLLAFILPRFHSYVRNTSFFFFFWRFWVLL